ncbi:RNA polymerase II C-terminal domain phosphatase-like 4 [Ipomoea triloba]|uniref:RNA polymerase II C-terminal domain phosphatase-like 4 n=1 Tax=Ipomoea triloba TaxID=35885 RepID=UPI00125E161F|nr:RNA polymerase II C-terminal domain phosphatase-like 4 [Ipomoea triloba]XP_031091315.1 RNA polymerase II C-terminal domain phosphatase-like 4 [Ipomoea triloba]XP_031091316.1 RNA polymerase II C-terminal domain phosphatase-like 4 [Ipomoea triloba]
MSLTADSPAHSSSSDDLAAFLDAELETASGTSSELEDVEAGVEEGEEEGKDDEQYEDENEDWGEDGDGKDDSDATRIKRRRVAIDECTGDTESSKSRGEPAETSDALKSSLFRLDRIHMMTKLRPFVNNFLKEASDLFEMYIYTMGERPYALEMAKLLDPRDVYFHSRVIAQGDSTQRHQKGLDIVLGQESSVLILDDTEVVWGKHKENIILMDRYHFFASSCHQFGFDSKSLSQLKTDESEENGALATVLAVLKRIHGIFFDQKRGDNLLDRDVREVLKGVRKEVLEGCKIVFSQLFPTKFQAENHHLWRMAEQLGATCTTELDQSVTHVVSMDAGIEKSRCA